MMPRTLIGASLRNWHLVENGDLIKTTLILSSKMITTDKIPRNTTLSPMIPTTATISSKVAHQPFGMLFAYGAKTTSEQWLWRW